MSSIFLSHSSQDNTTAEQVKVRLEQWGHRSIFLDFDPSVGIPAGRDWEKELYAKLRECRAVIILCSRTSMASRWCFVEITHAKALGKPVFPISIDEVALDPVLTSFQVIDARTGWDMAYQRLEKGLIAAGLDPKGLFDWDTKRPPYPGLLAFQEEDAAIFFGRDKEIREGQALLNRLQQFGGPRLVLMLGASGSGKSSLMRAGLLPRLKRDPRWVVIEPFRPLTAPFEELTRVMGKHFSQVVPHDRQISTDETQLGDQLYCEEHEAEKSVGAFLNLTKELREVTGARDATNLLMIDQCEELLTVDGHEEGDRFLAFLRAVLDRKGSQLMVLATLRSDFLGSFQEHALMRGLRIEPFAVSQMAVDDVTSVIEGPARVAGLELGPGLVQAMVSDTKTADALPLLAFTLRELWEGFGEDNLLTCEEYRDKLGGLEGSIARAAEAVLKAEQLSEQELSALQNALLSMIRVNDKEQYAKQPAQWKDLPAHVHAVLERFVTARLLISSGDGNERSLEVAHEAMFRAWPRLVEWLKDNKSFLSWQPRLNAAKGEWEGSQRRSDLLLRGLPLAVASDWMTRNPDLFSPEERYFVSVSQRRRNRRRFVAATLGGFVLMILMLGSYGERENQVPAAVSLPGPLVVEVDDYGRFWNREAADTTLKTIAAASEDRNTIVSVFIHGWHHNADKLDEDFLDFQTLLDRLRAKFQEPHYAAARHKLRLKEGINVIGLYVGWRGRSLPGWLDYFTFWGRKAVAEQIGGGDLREFFVKLQNIYRDQNSDASKPTFMGLLTIGHSFGAQVLFTAISGAVEQDLLNAVANAQAKSIGAPKLMEIVNGLGDMTVLLNPAMEAFQYDRIDRLTKNVSFMDSQAPVLLTVSAEDDSAPKYWFPIARALNTLFRPQFRTDELKAQQTTALGEYEPQQTHELHVSAGTPAQQDSFPNNCEIVKEDLTGRPVSSGGAELSPKNNANYSYSPVVIAHTSNKLLHEGNGIFGANFSKFLINYVAAVQAKRICLIRGQSFTP